MVKLTADMSLTGNGLRDWLVQRFTSIIIVVYFFTIIGFFYLNSNVDYATLRSFFASMRMQIFSLIFLLSLILHAWVGIWTVVTDYVNPASARIIVQSLVILSLVIYFFWGVEIFWRIA